MPPIQLKSFDEFRAILHRGFVILCGSAVSFGPDRATLFLPGVDASTAWFYRLLARQLGTHIARSYHRDVLVTYAQEFVDGRYAALRRRTKFEEFIGRVANHWDHGPRRLEHSVLVADLLSALFECSENQFNLNHAAIAFLLRNRITDAILTTNFDNAIEQAVSNHRGYSCKVFGQIEEQGMTYLTDTDPDLALGPLRAAACTYRIALGPRAGQKVLDLQTVPTRGPSLTTGCCVSEHGFSLHAEVLR